MGGPSPSRQLRRRLERAGPPTRSGSSRRLGAANEPGDPARGPIRIRHRSGVVEQYLTFPSPNRSITWVALLRQPASCARTDPTRKVRPHVTSSIRAHVCFVLDRQYGHRPVVGRSHPRQREWDSHLPLAHVGRVRQDSAGPSGQQDSSFVRARAGLGNAGATLLLSAVGRFLG
jgi:hypothetical protein